ncbi:tetratricopeptide repeat protein [Streptococcus hongkongensis]
MQFENYEQAIELIQEEKQIIDKYFKDDLLKNAVNNYEQGFLRLKLGNHYKAMLYMQLSLEQALKTDDLIAQACAYRGVGDIYQSKGKIEDARIVYNHAYKLFEKVGEDIGLKEIEIKLGELPFE